MKYPSPSPQNEYNGEHDNHVVHGSCRDGDSRRKDEDYTGQRRKSEGSSVDPAWALMKARKIRCYVRRARPSEYTARASPKASSPRMNIKATGGEQGMGQLAGLTGNEVADLYKNNRRGQDGVQCNT